jgi:hypothetical protein
VKKKKGRREELAEKLLLLMTTCKSETVNWVWWNVSMEAVWAMQRSCLKTKRVKQSVTIQTALLIKAIR